MERVEKNQALVDKILEVLTVCCFWCPKPRRYCKHCEHMEFLIKHEKLAKELAKELKDYIEFINIATITEVKRNEDDN